jgi:hypothetical protein
MDTTTTVEELIQLAESYANMRLEATDAVPEMVAAGARQLFRPGGRERSEQTSVVERLPAQLRFDSACMQRALGMHGCTTRQLLVEAGPFELDLRSVETKAGWSLSGQLLGPTPATAGVARLIGASASARSELTDMLEFSVPPLPAGRYHLELLVGNATQIELDSLVLGI